MSRKYKDAAAKLHQNVQKHLSGMKEILSSDDEDPYESSVLEGVLSRYETGGGDGQMLRRTKILLEEAISGRPVTCLICIGSIKRTDPIWTCDHCYSYFHLTCIQKWAKDSVSLKSEENTGPIAVVKPIKIEWCCPKCRYAYPKDEIPRKYRCFCAKTDDPPLHPWLIPHSCGEICGKRLSLGENCKHKCLLLCHPGPCPPCPQMVNGACYCENERRKVRCSAAKWSCNKQCRKNLSCNSHHCEKICHEDECPPCSHTSIQPCLCGLEKVQRPCNNAMWQCQKRCIRPYSCGYHKCEKICHFGECGECPNSGIRSCPCGANQRHVECPDIMETCVSTCGKKRDDCEHNCPEKCHKGACPPCQAMVEKRCFCNTHLKSVPCSKEFKCDSKCRGTRMCGKHNCGRKCCNGNCPPCEKVCDKPLQCGRHKCTSVCHRGPCYPCPLDSKVTCRCKETSITVPCGRERHTKPPKCFKLCKIKFKCGHSTENAHACHFGDCPPCKAVCHKLYPCGHECKAICHENVAVTFKQVEKPATPWEIQPTRTKIMTLDCPPCDAPVPVTCFGGHETVNQPCHQASRYPCGRSCGQPLPCTNHSCAMLCHFTTDQSNFPKVPKKCEPCDKECQATRPSKCIHKCPTYVCHPGDCPPCGVNRRIPCHCGLNEIYLRCFELETVTEDKMCCKLQCPKNMQCGHRCKNTCHSGPCSSDKLCTRKTKVYCSCGGIKKEIPCNDAKETNKIACDETCEAKKMAAVLEKEKEERRLKELEEERNKKELAEFERKMGGKKRKYKEKKLTVDVDDRNVLQKYWLPILSLLVVIFAAVYYIFYV